MKIYKVGGAVRDSLLKVNASDNDWVVVGSSPKEMIAEGYKPIGKDFPVFLHPETNEEYALARTEKKSGISRKSKENLFLMLFLKNKYLNIRQVAISQKSS